MVRLSVPVASARNLVGLFSTYHKQLPLVYYITGKLYSEGEGLNYGLAEYNLRMAASLAPETDVAADANASLAMLLLKKPAAAENRLQYLEESLQLAGEALKFNPDNEYYSYISNEAARLIRLEEKGE